MYEARHHLDCCELFGGGSAWLAPVLLLLLIYLTVTTVFAKSVWRQYFGFAKKERKKEGKATNEVQTEPIVAATPAILSHRSQELGLDVGCDNIQQGALRCSYHSPRLRTDVPRC